MCNRYESYTAYDDYVRMMAEIDLRNSIEQGPEALPDLGDVQIGDTGPVIVAAGNGVALRPMRFGFPPPRPRASPVFNFKSENRSFADSRRCIIPARSFYEFTGDKYPKTMHRFRAPAWPMLAIAGIWRQTEAGEAFTMLTTAPGPDIAPIHDRQIVILAPADWAAWLYLSKPESTLLQPLPPGTLVSEVVRPGATP